MLLYIDIYNSMHSYNTHFKEIRLTRRWDLHLEILLDFIINSEEGEERKIFKKEREMERWSDVQEVKRNTRSGQVLDLGYGKGRWHMARISRCGKRGDCLRERKINIYTKGFYQSAGVNISGRRDIAGCWSMHQLTCDPLMAKEALLVFPLKRLGVAQGTKDCVEFHLISGRLVQLTAKSSHDGRRICYWGDDRQLKSLPVGASWEKVRRDWCSALWNLWRG